VWVLKKWFEKWEQARIAKKTQSFSPTTKWSEQLSRIKSELATARQQNHNRLKKESWDNFHESLIEFEKITLRQSDKWKHDYLKAIRRWIEESEKEQKRLEMLLQTTESVSANFFRKGEALNPGNFGHQPFFGREDLKNELAFRVLSSGNMPTFLLQGQRRVGKTSLLNFLPVLLGPGFLVITQDMQSDEFESVSDVFNGLVRKLRRELQKEIDDNDEMPKGMMDAWKHFREFIELAAQTEQRKIILGFDEYENFHKLLKAEGETGERLIEAMRAFSQEQNNVVFLFTGLHLFSDLGEPDFGRHFVQTHRLKVDYLKPEDARKLITEPYPDFNVTYPPDMVEEMIRLTKGHPALLQHICYELVNRANIQSRRNMNHDDLTCVLQESVLDRGNEVMVRFWVDFCRQGSTDSMRETVWEIMKTRDTENRRDRARLLDYGFIIKTNDRYSLRVPLFEQWIERHGESF
jgi:Arc/MetJ-type ribon-helix-helix transcriptional regulator